MPSECALCDHYASEHLPAFINPARPCQVRHYHDLITREGHVLDTDYIECGCPGYEPKEDDPQLEASGA